VLHRTLLTSVVALAAALLPATAGAAGTTAPADPRSHIVVLKDTATDPGEVATMHGRRLGASPGRIYTDALKGYAAALPDESLEAVRRDPRVAYVEPDGPVQATAQNLPWGINRVDADTSSTLAGNGSGGVSNVNAFVIDTGISKHPDLRVVRHVNFAGGPNTDCSGHGTHVAGTLAAKDNTAAVVGVAPGASLTGVKVLGCDDYGTKSDVIAGIDYVTRKARRTGGPDVANLSLGDKPSPAVDDAVRRSARSGVFYAVAAGNQGGSACETSPARAGAGTNNGIATVAATDTWDREARFSNYGACVDIWAPGVSILSTRRGGGTGRMSGTSSAAPHVSGGGALYRSRHSASPSDLERKLRESAAVPGTRSENGHLIHRLFVGGSAGF
jgi:aqualysin 1